MSSKRVTLNTDGCGCVARSLNKGATKCHRNTQLSLCSSRFWAATAPSFKVNLRLNLRQSKVAESAAGSRTTTTTVCELAKFRRKSHFDEESAAINSQPKTFAERTQVPLKRATLNTDCRGCVARSLNKGTILTKPESPEHQMLRTRGYVKSYM
jgi:ribosomal protein L44E